MVSTIEAGSHAFGSYSGDPEELRKLEDRLKKPPPWHEIPKRHTIYIKFPRPTIQTAEELQAEQDYIERRTHFPDRDY